MSRRNILELGGKKFDCKRQLAWHQPPWELSQFWEEYKDKLPVMIMVFEGFHGVLDFDIYSVEDTLIVSRSATQYRVIARDVSRGEGYVSMPVDYPVYVRVIDEDTKEPGQARPLKEVLEETPLPVTVKLEQGAGLRFFVSVDLEENVDFDLLRLIDTYKERYLLGHTVVTGELFTGKPLVLPLYLPIKVSVPTRMTDPDVQETEWVALWRKMFQLCEECDFSEYPVNTEMMMYSDEDIKSCDGVYDYIWPKRYVKQSYGKRMKPLPQKPPEPKGPTYPMGFRPPRVSQIKKVCDMTGRKLPAPPAVASCREPSKKEKREEETQFEDSSDEEDYEYPDVEVEAESRSSSGEDSEGYEDVEAFMRARRASEPVVQSHGTRHLAASRVRVFPKHTNVQRSRSEESESYPEQSNGSKIEKVKHSLEKMFLPSNVKMKLPPPVKPKPNLSVATSGKPKTVPKGVVSPRLVHQVDPPKNMLKPESGISIRTVEDIPKDISGLGVKELCECLVLMDMEKYVDVFKKNQVNGPLLKELDVDDLQTELGMPKLAAIKVQLFAEGKWRPEPDS